MNTPSIPGIAWFSGRDGAVRYGDRVLIKRDLSGKGNWTIEACDGVHKGKVVAHCSAVAVSDASTKVSAATQQRWMGQRKKPCAWIAGTLAPLPASLPEHARRVTFDFHSGRTEFYYASDGVVYTASNGAVFTDGAYAI
jgi:hypothetical protein